MNCYKYRSRVLFILTCFIGPGAVSGAMQVDIDSRWQVRDFYAFVHSHGSEAVMNWTGDYASGSAGTVSADWLEATRVRVNFFRAMAGVPTGIQFDPLLNAKSQQSSLMMSANGALSHFPPNTWKWWTQDGYDAANSGNLAIGSTGADAIEGYMIDFGGSAGAGQGNYTVGHRRWVLFPASTVMGSGDVPGDQSQGLWSANTLWVFPESYGARPATRDDFVAWPPPGHVPSSLVWSRWSLSYPNADFRNATVTMQSGGESIPVVLEPVVHSPGSYPEATLVWVPSGMDTTGRQDWPTPNEDEVIEVSVGNVLVDSQPRTFTYSVTVFDAGKAGQDEFVHEANIMGATAIITAPVTIQADVRPWAEAVQGRILEAEAYNAVHGAENAENPFIVSISPGYSPIQNGRVASGSAAFHLVNPDFTTQTLTFSERFIVGSSAPALNFQSSLAYAGEGQYASVDIAEDGTTNWKSLWSESGPVLNNAAFTLVNLDLSAFSGKTVRLRFRYDYIPGKSAYTQISTNTGWALDDIALTGVSRLTDITELPPAWGSDSFQVTFEEAGPVFVQTRSIAFDGFPLEWGPVLEVNPGPMTALEVPLGNWMDDPVLGWTFGSNESWKYNLVMGYIYEDTFPWLYAQGGWVYYVTGSVYNGLWIYHADYGYGYTQADYGGWFIHSPFDRDAVSSWKRFFP